MDGALMSRTRKLYVGVKMKLKYNLQRTVKQRITIHHNNSLLNIAHLLCKLFEDLVMTYIVFIDVITRIILCNNGGWLFFCI